MRALVLAGAVLLTGLLVPAPPAVAACTESYCGVPECWSASPRVRPAMPRVVRMYCSRVDSAKVLTQPAHAQVSDVSIEWGLLRFTVLADEDAPRHDELVLELTGPWDTVEWPVPLEIIPTSENYPPSCYGQDVTRRSDGSGPVELQLHAWCSDPENDAFVMEGGGPGVHLDSPMQVASADYGRPWHYRTATHAGTETATTWATDELGARSYDAASQVTVGPGIDRLPECFGQPGYLADGAHEVYSRPGTTRRFGIYCYDADADAFVAAPTALPARGVLAPVMTENTLTEWHSEQRFDTTYVPASDTMEPDEFTMTATGTRGAQPARIRIVPRALPDNRGGWCSWGSSYAIQDTAAALTTICVDDEGDDLSAEIVDPPRHGTAGPPVVTPGLYGTADVRVPYVPEAGFVGYDCVKIKVTDGHGFEQTMLLEVTVQEYQEHVPAPVPEIPPPLPLPHPYPYPFPSPPQGFSGPPMTPAAVSALVTTYVKEALDTTSVRKLSSTGGAQVWAPAKLSKAELLRDGVEPAMVVLCPTGCRLRTDTELFTGSRARARASRRQTAQVLAPGQGHLLWMTLDDEQRGSLRKAKGARATVRLAMRPTGGKARSVKRAIPFGR